LLWQQAPNVSHLLGLMALLIALLALITFGMGRYRHYLAQRVVAA